MQMVYSGSQPSVDVPSLGLYDVARDEPVEVDSPEACDQLAAQGWERIIKSNSGDKPTQEGTVTS